MRLKNGETVYDYDIIPGTGELVCVDGHCFGDGRDRVAVAMALQRPDVPLDAAVLGSPWLEAQARLVVGARWGSRARLFSARPARGPAGGRRVLVPGSEEEKREC